jgi:beta-phosphoglucomutase
MLNVINAPKMLHRSLYVGMKYFITPEANYLILRHFVLGSEVLRFIKDNVRNIEDIPMHPLKPMHLDAVKDNLFLQHDLNLYNFIINLNNAMAKKGITIQKVEQPDFSAITTDDSFPFMNFPDRWTNCLDLSNAIEIFTPVYQFFLPMAFIFDMDGTIVDNMAFHTDSWLAFFERHGKTYDADAFFRETAGAQGREILRERLGPEISEDEIAVLAHEKDELYREMYGPHRSAIQGFEDFVTAARAQGVKLAVATSAPPANIVFTLDELDLRRHFDTVVGAADVARGKPHPDVFLKAAEKLGVDPRDCIVFEDAPMGVEAARRAGMKAVVITTTLPAEAFREFDNVVRIVEHYEDLNVGELLGTP